MQEDKTVGQEHKLPCLECDTDTYHKVVKSVSLSEDTEWGYFWSKFEIVLCQGCRNVSFRKTWGTDEMIGYDDDGDEIYEENEDLFPSRIKGRKQIRYHYHLPQKVQKIYQETHQALSGKQSILAGIGIRALVEAVCAEKKATGKDLKEKIDSLVFLGVLTKEGAEILHQTRIQGNGAAHETVEIKEEDLGILMDIAENLLENVYIIPKKAVDLKAKNDLTKKT